MPTRKANSNKNIVLELVETGAKTKIVNIRWLRHLFIPKFCNFNRLQHRPKVKNVGRKGFRQSLYTKIVGRMGHRQSIYTKIACRKRFRQSLYHRITSRKVPSSSLYCEITYRKGICKMFFINICNSNGFQWRENARWFVKCVSVNWLWRTLFILSQFLLKDT